MNNICETNHLKLVKFAILNGDKPKILRLLQQDNIDLKIVHKNGDTILHFVLKYASRFSETQIIEILNDILSRGVDINIKNNAQETVLHLAIAKQLEQVVNFLLKHDADIAVIDNEGNSVVHYYVKKLPKGSEIGSEWSQYRTIVNEMSREQKESRNFVEFLLLQGFNVDEKNNKGQSALHLAIEYNLQHILPSLLKYTADINFVSEKVQQNLLQLFLSASHVTNQKFTKLSKYIPKYVVRSVEFPKQLAIEIVTILLERCVSVDHEDTNGLTALHMAIQFEEHEIIEMLIDRFTKVKDKCGNKLINEVIEKATWGLLPQGFYLIILSTLTARGADVNFEDEQGMTPVYHAVKHKNLAAVDLMRKNYRVNFSVKTKKGNILLHALAEKRNHMKLYNEETLFDILVSERCHVNAKNKAGQTPLHVAADNNNIDIVRMLVTHGADVNCRDTKKGLRPLHIAARRSSAKILRFLLEHGAKINDRNRSGETALHVAAACSAGREVFQVLLEGKAEVNARDRRGRTALAKALYGSDAVGVEELLKHGADAYDFSVIRTIWYCRRSTAGNVLSKHWLKIKAARLPRHTERCNFIIEHEGNQRFYEDCFSEIEVLKTTWIDDDTTLYDWLRMHPDRRYIYNEKLRDIVESSTLEEEFPRYASVILGNYRETLARKPLLEPAKEAWLKLTEIYLPNICLECILTHLNTGDMFAMTEMSFSLF